MEYWCNTDNAFNTPLAVENGAVCACWGYLGANQRIKTDVFQKGPSDPPGPQTLVRHTSGPDVTLEPGYVLRDPTPSGVEFSKGALPPTPAPSSALAD